MPLSIQRLIMSLIRLVIRSFRGRLRRIVGVEWCLVRRGMGYSYVWRGGFELAHGCALSYYGYKMHLYIVSARSDMGE